MKRYNHNRSNTELTSFGMGKIIPTMMRHCIQGTTLKGGISAALELAPMVHQALSQIRVDTFAIAAADRLVWDDAEDFYTGGETGDVRPTPPYILAPADTGWAVGSLADHLGFPTGVPGIKCNAIPFRILVKWWNENIRNPLIQDELPMSTASGLDTTTYTGDLLMNWPKDMFTTATPEQQLGNEVLIPLAESAPVVGTGMSVGLVDGFSGKYGLMKGTQTGTGASYAATSPNAYGVNLNQQSAGNITGNGDSYTLGLTTEAAKSGMVADLTNATGILPSDFNLAMARQKWKQRRNLFGSAYRDLLAFLGVKYSDRRLGYISTLAHGKNIVDISGVLQTAPGSDSVVGEMAGRGSGFGHCSYKTYFEEWTTVIHLVCVRPAPVYVNMQPVDFQWEIREDLYTPEFAKAGMVQIKKGILFPTGTDTDAAKFGWGNPYDEMRSGFNHVSGKFKTTNMSYHQGRVFESQPSLNNDFLKCLPSTRIFANLNDDAIEAAAIRNTFIERNIVLPSGTPKF